MKMILFASCFFISVQMSAQVVLSDSMKMAIKLEFFARARKDQMKDFPDFFKQPVSDSLVKLRDGYFVENFKYVIELTKQYGYPNIKRIAGNRDYVIGPDYHMLYTLPNMTILHIFQTHPKMLLTDDVIELFERELANGNMDRKNTLESAMVFYTKFSQPCVQDMERMNYALVKWGLKPLDSRLFFVCN